MSQSTGGRFKLTIKKTGSQAQVTPSGIEPQTVASQGQPSRASQGVGTPNTSTAPVAARVSATGNAPRQAGLSLRGSSKASGPRPGANGAPKLSLKGAGSAASAASVVVQPAALAVSASAGSAAASSSGKGSQQLCQLQFGCRLKQRVLLIVHPAALFCCCACTRMIELAFVVFSA